MRKKKYFDKEWISRTFRVREETIELYTYLEYKAVGENISKYALFDKIVEFSIEKIIMENPELIVKEFNSKREVKGFTISKENNDILEKFIKLNSLNKGEVVELLIAIYAKYKLTEEELKILRTYLI